MNILIVVAHPDDEVLGCGGTIPLLANDGHHIITAIMGEGSTSRTIQQGSVESLSEQSQRVAEILGTNYPIPFNLPDNRFDTVPLLEVVKYIEGIIWDFQPTIVYTHHSGDLNIDHTTVHRAVLTATRPLVDCPVEEIYTFEVPSSTEWGVFPVFRPNTFVDIHSTLETKIQAMNIYGNETREFPHPRSAKALRARARYWGSVAGVEAAEPFELIRKVEYGNADIPGRMGKW